MVYKDPEQMRAYQREWMRKRREAWFESKGNRCVRCGSSDRLEVDHIDPTKKVSHSVWSWADKRRFEELAKCQSLCYSCHLAKTQIDKINMFPLRHGENAGYSRGCRCDPCREAHALLEKNRRKALKK